MRLEIVLIVGGLATLLAIVLSGSLVLQHFRCWTKPSEQVQVVRIVAMAPLFAFDSFVGLLELEEGEVVAHALDMVKECYEALAIHSFLMLMYGLCGLSHESSSPLPEGAKGRELHVPFPLGLLYSHPHFDAKWLRRLRRWTLQFVVLRPILSTIDLIFVDLLPGPYSAAVKIIVAIALNVSVTVAFYALLTFYHAFEEDLAPSRPLAKLICIKGVVFFSTWQGVALKLLAHFGVLHEGHRFSVDEIELAWQDLLVCVEMGLIFGPLHLYAFPPNEYEGKREVGKNGSEGSQSAKEIEMKKKN